VRQNAFRYRPVPPPVIRSVLPRSVAARGGDKVTVEGEHFSSGCTVWVGAQEVASVGASDGYTLEFEAPPDSSGEMMDVTVKGPGGEKAVAKRAFVYGR
jgi:hypothetical protein